MKTAALILGLSLGLTSQIAAAESTVICESSLFRDSGGYLYNGGYEKAVEKINTALKNLKPQPSQVSAPAIANGMGKSGDPSTIVVCVTITD